MGQDKRVSDLGLTLTPQVHRGCPARAALPQMHCQKAQPMPPGKSAHRPARGTFKGHKDSKEEHTGLRSSTEKETPQRVGKEFRFSLVKRLKEVREDSNTHTKREYVKRVNEI